MLIFNSKALCVPEQCTHQTELKVQPAEPNDIRNAMV